MEKSFGNLRRIVYFVMFLAIAFSVHSLDAKASVDNSDWNHANSCSFRYYSYGTFPTISTTNYHRDNGLNYMLYHTIDREEICSECYQLVKSVTLSYDKHTMGIYSVDNEDGSVKVVCTKCGYFNICHANIINYITQSDKKAYISVYGVTDGVITLQIGSRKYYKKIAQTSLYSGEYAFNIKKPKKGQKIKIYLTVGSQTVQCFPYAYSEVNEKQVLISRNPKKGMTRKQVKNYTAFGDPYDAYKNSKGYEYWYLKNGSYVIFKKGKVYRFSMKK